MARGMANGEGIVSQANSKEFDEGYDRIFGKREPKRGRWVWDDRAQKLIPASEYVPPATALNAPVMVDRFYENTRLTDGTKINSRKDMREYFKATGYTHASDYTNEWKKAAEKREAAKQGHIPSKTRREVLRRAFYEKFKY